MKSSTKCFIVTTLHSLKVTSIDHQKYGEIWKSNIKMFWNSQYNVTQELSTSPNNWLKVAVKVATNCESIVIWTGNFSRTKSVSLSFSTESEVFVWKLWMDKKNIENITNDLLVAASSHWLRGLAYFTLALTKTVQDVKRNCTFTMKSFKTTNNMPILIKERQLKQSLFPFKSKIPKI